MTFIAHGQRTGKNDTEKTIIIREGAYVGDAAVLLPRIEIGSYAVIGAGAVVTKDVAPGAVVAGSPAKVLLPSNEKKQANEYLANSKV